MKKDLTIKLGQVSEFEIRLLKVFKSVVEAGGFAAAETELSIGRSTISIHIARLEQRLGLKLCRRGRAGFALTDEGLVVYGLMKELFSSLEAFRSGVNALHVELTGELRVIASDAVCMASRARIPEAIRRFAQQAPDVKVLLDVKALTDIERMVLNDEADVGFIPYHRQFDGLCYVSLYSDRCHLFCGRQHPLYGVEDSDELLAKVLHAKVVHAGVQTSPAVGEQLADMNKAAISYFYEARLAMLLSGVYVGFMPDNYVQGYIDSGELWSLVPTRKFYDLGVAAITRAHGKSNRARELFIRIVQELHGDSD
ncbi:LysR family transcriptional regulator [Marinobacterium rhizophilum]|uniref:LysR family transcriptional regulator n=1 Tax=Marinobacterium rhizophilum TaxID=420402 RepID=A0ABY5HRQ9_9GAMM|nr:LysR family transcriptional regulator [Marinobacterium rhizophilum]UTW13611.1 LysR family transcriptional regulator [Marinobacterium rhizophilum]